MHHILVVDDDPHIRDVICFALDKAGYATTTAKDGNEALEAFQRQPTDLIVLDVGLPEKDGLEVCRQIRKESETPILFLSARDEEIDRVLGLEIGGDDYVTKPFSPRELVARVGVILKRSKAAPPPADDDVPPLRHGDLILDTMHHSASFAGTPVKLTAIEFELLRTVLSRPRMTFNREQIMLAAYPTNIHISDRTIDSHIRKVRSKLSEAGCSDVIETVHGVGFRLGSCQPDT
jgi:two-component system OmpR family response regulator